MASAEVEKLTELLAKSRAFGLSNVQQNQSGWGPSGELEIFDGIPFTPFNKADKLGRVSDWIHVNKYYSSRNHRTYGANSGSAFGYSHALEESSFSVVDNTPRFKPRDGRRRYAKFSIHNRRRKGRGYRRHWRNQWNNRRGKNKRGWQRRRWANYQQEQKDPSVPVQPDWKQVGTLDFADISKSTTRTPAGTTIVGCGQVEKYSSSMARISPRMPLDLARFENREFITATTSEDPVMQGLMEQKAGNVFGTDIILSVLMASVQSVNPWDLVVKKQNGIIVFDRRPTSRIDFLSVNENWNEVQETDLKSPNHPLNLSQEATLINHNFSQHVLDSKSPKHSLGKPNPFLGSVEEGSQPASMGYLYRRWQLSDDIKLVGRCEINGYTMAGGQRKYVTVKALNEFDYTLSGNINWRTTLEHNSAAVLASEMKNNNCKLAKWTAGTLLAGTNELRLGFVSRVPTHDGSLRHEVLLVKKYKLQMFCQQLHMRRVALWGALKSIIELVMEQEDGRYILMRDPNETKLQLYAIPDGPISDVKPVL